MDQEHVEPGLFNEADQLEETPEEEVQPQEPVMVRIRYAGQTLEVPEHLADVWEKREAEFQRRFSEQGQELGRLRQQTQPPPRQEQTSHADEDLEFFANPSQMIQKRLAAEREQLRQELLQEQRAQEGIRQFWQSFYTNNKDLVGRDRLVNAVFQQEYANMVNLTPEAAQRHLASVIHEMLGSAPAEKQTLNKRQVVSEGSSNPPVRRTRDIPAQTTDSALGLSAAIKARAEARRKAQYLTPKDE